MLKLLNAYRVKPSLKNAQRVRSYQRSHMMAVCMLTVEDQNLLASAISHSNSGKPDEAWIDRLK